MALSLRTTPTARASSISSAALWPIYGAYLSRPMGRDRHPHSDRPDRGKRGRRGSCSSSSSWSAAPCSRSYVWGQSVSGFFLGLSCDAWRKTLRGFAACAGLTFVIALAWFAVVFAHRRRAAGPPRRGRRSTGHTLRVRTAPLAGRHRARLDRRDRVSRYRLQVSHRCRRQGGGRCAPHCCRP